MIGLVLCAHRGQLALRNRQNPASRHITGWGTFHGHSLLRHSVSSTFQWRQQTPPVVQRRSSLREAIVLKIRKPFRGCEYSFRGSRNFHSLQPGIHYSHHPGTIIHIDRNTHVKRPDSICLSDVNCGYL